jgi:preprotein translocase subunit SecG
MLAVLMIIWVVLFIVSSVAFDKIILHLFEHENATWKALGKPRGFFIKPKGSSRIGMWKLSYSRDMPSSLELLNSEVISSNWAKLEVMNKVTKWYAIVFLPLAIVAVLM